MDCFHKNTSYVISVLKTKWSRYSLHIRKTHIYIDLLSREKKFPTFLLPCITHDRK
jgi:hypothetical protein